MLFLITQFVNAQNVFIKLKFENASDSIPIVANKSINDDAGYFLLNTDTIYTKNDQAELKFKAPNPSNGMFELVFESETLEDLNYEVYDIVGKQLFKDLIKKGVKSSFVNLENYPQGMYLFHIKTGNTLVKKKLIKI